MATGPREEFTPARWLSAKRGTFFDYKKNEELGWVSGAIDGIRIHQSEKFNHLELHLRIVDPDEGGDGETIILAGSLTVPGERFSVWTRMLVARLANDGNALGPGEMVRISCYPIATDYGPTTGVALTRDGDDALLQGIGISVNDRGLMVKCLYRLIREYPWGRGATKPEIETILKEIAGHDHVALPDAEDAEFVVEEDAGAKGDDVPPPSDRDRLSTNGSLAPGTPLGDAKARVEQVNQLGRGGDDLPF